jgi:hypothetical protein
MRILNWALGAAVLAAGAAQAGTVVVSGGASMVQGITGEESRLSSLQVTCASVNRTNVGYLCGFDDGERSVMQFEDRADGQTVRFFDGEGREISGVRRVGTYYVFPKIYPMVFARVAGKEAVLLRSADKRVVEAGQQASGARGSGRVLVIREGERYDKALEAAAAAEGWKFKWWPNRSWKAPSDIDLSQYKDVSEAVIDIVEGLHMEGRPVKWRISDGNKYIEVLSTEVRND